MQQQMNHQMMGYDRTATMFSPEGRLLQAEYAKKAVKQGTAALGIVFKGGVILIADKRVNEKLIVIQSVEKIFQVDDHIGATATGYVMDGRILIERAQLIAQQHRITYDEAIDTLILVKEISNLKQAFTQYGGARPFGVSILFAGVNHKKAHLYLTDPTGIYQEYKATAIGEYESEIKDILEKEYKDNMDMDSALRLGLKALKKVLGKEFDIERIDSAYITLGEKQFKRVPREKIKKGMK